MKYLLFVFMLFQYSLVLSQVNRNLMGKSFECFKKGEIDSAVFYANKHITIDEKANQNQFELEEDISFLGKLYMQINEKEKAISCFKKVFDRRLQRLGGNVPQTFVAKYELANCYFLSDQKQVADIMFTELITDIEHIQIIDDDEYIKMYLFAINSLVNIYLDINRFDIVSKLHQYKIDLTNKIYGKHREEYIQEVKKYASFNRRYGNINDAINLLLGVLQLEKNSSSLYIKTTIEIIDIYDNLGRYDDCKQLLFDLINRIKPTSLEYPLVANKIGRYNISLGNFKDAEDWLIKALEKQENITGRNTEEYADILLNLGGLYVKQKKYDEAESSFLEVFTIKSNKYGKEDPVIVTSIYYNLSDVYIKLNREHEAETLLLNGLEILEKKVGKNSIIYLSWMGTLADYYKKTKQFIKGQNFNKQIIIGHKAQKDTLSFFFITNLIGYANFNFGFEKYDESLPLYSEGIKLLEQNNWMNTPTYLVTLNNFAVALTHTGKSATVHKILKKILAHKKNIYGEKSIEYLNALENLATSYFNLDSFDLALRLLLITEKGKISVLSEKDNDYISCIKKIGVVYMKKGDWKNSIKFFNLCLEKIDTFSNKEEYIDILNNLGSIYVEFQDYERAEKLYFEALKLKTEYFNNVSTATDIVIFQNLSSLYKKLGDRTKQMTWLYMADVIAEKFTQDVSLFANTQHQIGILCMEDERLGLAEKHLNKALEIIVKFYVTNSSKYTDILGDISTLYALKGDFKKAQDSCNKALKLKKIMCGNNHYGYISELNELAYIHLLGKNYIDSEKLYLESIEIQLRFGMQESHTYILTLNNLLALYSRNDKLYEAFSIATKLQYQELKYLNRVVFFQNEKESSNYFSKNEGHLIAFKNCYFNYKNHQIATDFYNLELATKSLILRASSQMQQSILNSGDSLALQTFEDWRDTKSVIAKLYSLPKEKHFDNLDSLENIANNLEKELTRRSSAFRDEKTLLQTKYEDVQKTLKADEAAIEFSAFPYFNGTTWTDSTMYVALVLRKDVKLPVLVPLFEEKSLDSLLQRHSDNDSEHISSLYQADSPQSQKLYQLLWQPLEKSLSGVKKIYFSPSGKLHQIAFSALPQSKNTLLSDKYKLVQVNSTASLAEEKDTLSAPQSAVLFGGIDYNASEAQRSTIVKGFATSDATIAENRALPADLARGSNWNYLPGTKAEVEAIESIAKAKNITTTVFSRQAALEESFKRLAGKQSPDIIHVATHGFFFPDPKKDLNKRDFGFIDKERQPVFRRSDNPLYRGGLLFAGANQAWNGKESSENLEDGILTAYEVSNMYLPNTQLVVLSACETALGEIKGSEGVFGLQRAFQLSGARYLLMSLWKIPDAASAEFMKVFYQHYLGGKTVAEAFRFTQLFMRTKYKNEPYKWAAFVLIEG